MKFRTLIAVILFSVTTPVFAQFGGLGDFVKKNANLDTLKKVTDAITPMSETEEIDAGAGISAMILGATPLVANDDLQRYVNRVGRWVSMQSGRGDLPWEFGVTDSPSINAFAMPGGKVLVTLGLVRKLKSESELAGVLAHEVAHVALKHQLNAIQNAKIGALGQGALQSLADAKLAQTNLGSAPIIGNLASAAAGVGIESLKNGVFLRPLDRSLEYDADRLGVVLASRAGYDSYGLIAALQILATLTPDESSGSISMSTHPTPNDRLAELEKFANTLDKYATQPQAAERFAKVMAAIK